MGKIELLAPAGNMKSLKAAIHAGADAVYLSGKNYGARKYAENFTNEEIIEAIKYAHIYDVKVYVTANTIIYEKEVDEFINYIKFLYLSGVDAVLMQDIGMINLVRKLIPNLEIHASTQTHNCNDETLKLFKSLGIKRVVLARELSLNEINNLKTDIEKEVFIHGALCVCYSGNCLFSSLNGGRSANRGECAGPCRLPYSLIKDNKEIKTIDKYLLSTKELNTSPKIDELLKSNIQSLKIEGRMKSPEYVYFVTKMYRDLIDGKKLKRETTENLKKLFNRQFTIGHLFNDNIMNPKSPNHIGINIGKVLDTNKRIKIKLDKELSQNDGIRFKNSSKGMIVNKLYNEKGLLINKANKGDIIFLDNKINLKEKDTVLKTTDYLLEKSLKEYPLKKLKLKIDVYAHIDKPLLITFIHNNKKYKTEGNIIQKSINSPISKKEITEKLSRLGDTPFTLESININSDENIFIPVKELNEIRRKLVQDIINDKTKINRTIPDIQINNNQIKHSNQIKISASVQNESQLTALLPLVDYIYTDNYNLYKKYKNKQVFFKTERTAYKLKELKNENLLITNLGDLNKYSKTNNCHSDYFLNVVNSHSALFLKNKNINKITLSPELSLDQINDISSKINDLEVIVYGKIELMIIKKQLVNENGYYLKNFKNNLYPILLKNNHTIILSHEKINLLDKINYLKKIGITNLRFNFYDENPKDIIKIIKSVL